MQDEGNGQSLARLIRTHRLRAGLTQQRAAEAAGLSVAAIRDLEQGRTASPRQSSLLALAKVLHLKVNAIADHDDARERNADDCCPLPLPRETRIRLLGPLVVEVAGQPVRLGHEIGRALLSILALRANCPVPRNTIVARLWPDGPPPRAAAIISTHVARLRRRLGATDDRTRELSITFGYGGYQLSIPDHRVDALLFRSLAQQAFARARREPSAAYRLLADALALWRDDPLVDIGILRGAIEITTLWDQRIRAAIRYAELSVIVGSATQALPMLRELAHRKPLHEPLHACLVRTLAASGDQVAALEAVDAIRRRLRDELGLSPGAELREVHQEVLRQEFSVPGRANGGTEGLAKVSAAVSTREPVSPIKSLVPTPTPAQLPADISPFAGRDEELAVLDGWLAGKENGSRPVLIAAVAGMAGVGKTAFAVAWAHRARSRFPDGQLYLDLRGYGPSQPVSPEDALDGFLRELGVHGADIPLDLPERTARFRSLVAGRRMLILLDNAASAEQIRPLLPGGPSCVVLVTSRDALPGLTVREGARRLTLSPLSEAAGASLMTALLGSRTTASPALVATLSRLCGGLPLALRIVAERAADRPDKELVGLAADLSHRRLLDALEAPGDPRTSVRAVLGWSYTALSTAAAEVFRLLSLHPGTRTALPAIAALCGSHPESARAAVDELVRTHLLRRLPGAQFAMHDLLRAYGTELAAAEGPQWRRAALTRLFDYYLAGATTAMDVLYPAERHFRPRAETLAQRAPEAAGVDQATTWLENERENLLAVAVAACDDQPQYTIQMSAMLWRHLLMSGRQVDAVKLHSLAVEAAARVGDQPGEAAALVNLGTALSQWGRLRDADRHFARALRVLRQCGMQRSVTARRAVLNVGVSAQRQGKLDRAARWLRWSLELSEESGDEAILPITCNGIGEVARQQGRLAEAFQMHQRALTAARRAGNGTMERLSLASIGRVYLQRGNAGAAAVYARRALSLARRAGDRLTEATALSHLAWVAFARQDYPTAVTLQQQVLAISRQRGFEDCRKIDCLYGLAEAQRALGRTSEASGSYHEALAMAIWVRDRRHEAMARVGLGHLRWATGNHAQARDQWRQALDRYTAMGLRESEEVKRLLDYQTAKRRPAAR